MQMKYSMVLVCFLLFGLVEGLNSQALIERIGVSIGVFRSQIDYTVDDLGFSRRMGKLFTAQRLAYRQSSYINRRLDLETGLNIDFLNIQEAEKGELYYYQFDERRTAALVKHQQLFIGIPVGIVYRTFETASCVTYLKLSMNNKFRVYENEDFETEKVNGGSFLRNGESYYDHDQWSFEYAGYDMEFSFGTFWTIDGINARFCLEPKISLFSFVTANKLNRDESEYLHSSYANVFSNMGVELVIFKDL